MRRLASLLVVVSACSTAGAALAQAGSRVAAAVAIDTAADPTGAAAAWRAVLPGLTGIARGRALVQLGVALTGASDHKAALDALDQADPLLPPSAANGRDRARLLATRGSALGELNRLDEADATLDAAIAAWHRLAPAGSAEEADTLMAKATIAFSRGKQADATATGERSIAMFRRLAVPERAELIAALANMSTIHLQARELEPSERYAREATAMAGRILPDDHPVAIVALSDWVAVLAAQGRRKEAVPILGRIATLRERRFGPDYPPLAITYNNLSRNLFFLDEPALAEPHARRSVAIGIKTRAPDDAGFASMRDNLADILDALGKRGEAATIRREALAGLGPKGNPARIVRIRRSLGLSLIESGDLAGAADEFTTVVDWARRERAPGNPDRLEAEATLALLEARLGRPGAGERMHTALDSIETNLFAAGDATRRQTSLSQLLAHLLETAWLTHDRAAGFRVVQLQLLDETGRAVAATLARNAAGSGDAAALVRKRQDLLVERDRRSATALRAFGKGDADYKAAAAAVTEVDAQLATADAQLATVAPTYAALTRFTPLSVEAVQAKLHADQALVMPSSIGRGAVTFVVRHDTIDWAISPKGFDLAAAITAMRPATGDDTRGGDVATVGARPSFDAGRAHALYRALIPTTLDHALKGSAIWLLAPSGPFTALPFAALVTQPPVADRTPAWLIRKAALVTVPGLPGINDPAPPGRGERRFIGIGAPLLSGKQRPGALRGLYHGGTVDRGVLATLAPLPHAKAELEEMSAALPRLRPTLMIGADATETAVKASALRDIGVLAFATHGLVSGVGPGSEPGLVLTPPASPSAADDGVLSSSEIAALDIDADWVVLSACDTAAGDAPGAPALSGLARAFLYAGARSLLVSHWAVRDDVAARLTVETVRRERRGEGRPQALRHAMLALIDDPKVAGGGDPAVWAPFILVQR